MLETELFRFLENTADAVFSVDRQGLIRSWNHSAEKLFGYPAHEVLDKPCGPLFQGRGPLGALICGETCTVRECVLARREVANYDMEVKKRSGHRVWINVSILLYHDDRTGRKLVIHLVRDVSRRKKMEHLARRVVELSQQISVLPQQNGPLPPVPPLSEQEKRILRLLAEGKGPGPAAEELGITIRTLRNHLHHANQKLRTHSRLEAVVHATRRGLI